MGGGEGGEVRIDARAGGLQAGGGMVSAGDERAIDAEFMGDLEVV